MDLRLDPALSRAAALAAAALGASLAVVVRDGRALVASDQLDIIDKALAERAAVDAPLNVPDLRKHPGLREILPAGSHRTRALVSVALGDDALAGALVVFDTRTRKWSESEITLLRRIAEGLWADIALRQSVALLAQRESELGELLDHTNEMVCATGLDDSLTYVNAAWVRVLGYGAEEAAEMTFGDLVAPGHRARYEEMLKRVAGGEAVSDAEIVLVAHDGHRVVCRGRVTPRQQDTMVAGARHSYLDVTEARRSEALRARLAATLEATTDFVGITTQDGRVVYLNGAGRRLLGLPPNADLTDLDMSALRSAREQARITEIAIPSAVRDGTWEGESVLLGPAGGEIPVSLVLVAHPSTWPGEPPYFISAVMRDLRERVSAERALRESESRKQSMIDTALDCVITIDHEGRITEFNPAAETTFGYLREEAIGQRMVDLLVPERYRREHLFGFEDSVASGESHMLGRLIEMPALRGDGSEFVCEFSITRLPIDGPPAFTAFMRDITARKRLEETVANEREFLVAVLENLTEGVAVSDAEGRPTMINRALRATLGIVDHPGSSSHPAQTGVLYAADGLTPLKPQDEPLARAHRGEIVQDQELSIAHPSGEIRTLLASGRRIVGRSGERMGAVVALHDVTERRQAERLKSQLIRTVSHELRTPLTAIRGALEMLDRKSAALDEGGKALLAMASRNVSVLSRMVNDLLDVERIESGAATMEQEWVDSTTLMETARDLTQTVADAAGVSIDVSGEPLEVWADPDRLTQVITNLVGNAIKFSPRGSVVRLSAQRFDDDSAICFTVADSGRGIPGERLDSIFEPFEQVEAADAHDHGGTGLGLTICRAIVRQHGGAIWAESTPGEGSIFRFVLPAHFESPDN